jgi:hypothetical protein
MACNDVSQNFARTVFAKSARADALYLNGEAIAVVMTIFCGDTGFTVKTAYDDAYAKFSASRLLEVELLKDFLDRKWAGQLDSGTNGTHVIDDFWPERISVGTLAFSLAPHFAKQRLSLYCSRHNTERKLKSRIKAFLKRD